MKSRKRDYFYFDFENNTSGWIRRKRNQFGYIYLLCHDLKRRFDSMWYLQQHVFLSFSNTVWVRALLCKLQQRVHSTRSASDKVYRLLAHGRWFSPGTPASSTTKTGRHDIAETLSQIFSSNRV
jgi:hypothetical protein